MRNGAAKEDGRWDLNLGAAAIERGRPRGSEVNREKTMRFWRRGRRTMWLWSAPFLPHSLGSRRDFAGKKRVERTLAGGP